MSGVSESGVEASESLEQLHELDVALTELATSTEAGYFERAQQTFIGEGILHLVGQQEIIDFAKGIAMKELGEWAEAVDRYETAKLSADEYFSTMPNVSWLLVGDKSGKVRYARTKRSTYIDEIRIIIEETYREKVHMFSAPLETSPDLSSPTIATEPTAFQLNMDVVPPHDKPTI